MQLTYYGQSCFSITVKGKILLFDPFISGNPLAKHVDINHIEADYIFITHGHGDHVQDLLFLAQKTGALCVCAAEISQWLNTNGITNTHGMNHGSYISFNFGKVRGVNAVHSSSMPDGSYGGNPMGFVFKTEEGDFYAAGDTALTVDMQLIPYWAQLRFALLPIGGNYTMDAEDALLATEFIKCDTVIGIHYNTFPPITIDTEAARKIFTDKSKKLLLPAVGETISL